MSEFFDQEAVESDHEAAAGSSGDESDTVLKPRKKKEKGRRKRKIVSDDEEEDDEEQDEQTRREMQDFVVDEDEPDGDEEKSDEKESSSDDDDLEDDDLALVEENLKIKVRKNKRQRIQEVQDSDDEDAGAQPEEREKNQLERALFDGEQDELASIAPESPVHVQPAVFEDEGELDESDDEDNWLVDDVPDSGKKRRDKHFQRQRSGRPDDMNDGALDEARDIFGVDFDYDEFMQDGTEGYEEDEEYDDEELEIDEATGEPIPRASRKKKSLRKTLLEEIEPSELERGFLNELDKRIQLEDKPERFQTRAIPVTEGDDLEMKLESAWIYYHGFCKTTVSMQDDTEEKEPAAIPKIEEALKLIRNQRFEVPFIAFYRKEYVEPELSITDLWKVHQYDEKWCQLKNRKGALTSLFRRMLAYQVSKYGPDDELPSHCRIIGDSDFDRIDTNCDSSEALSDMYALFDLYYGRDVPDMIQFEREKAEAEGTEPPIAPLKKPSRRDTYQICVEAGLAGFVSKFGLTPAQFGENVMRKYDMHQPYQYPVPPLVVAEDYLSNHFTDAEAALSGAIHMLAIQLSREPDVRNQLRKEFYDTAFLSIRPTKKGKKEIDENHPVYVRKYLKDKQLKCCEKDEFLYLVQAENNKLIKLKMHLNKMDEPDQLLELLLPWFYKDEFSNHATEWNNARKEVLRTCIDKILVPVFAKEAKQKLQQEAMEFVIKECCTAKLYTWLKIGPYTLGDQEVGDDEDLREGIKVLGITYVESKDQAAFGALVDSNGEMIDYLKIPCLTVRRNDKRSDMKAAKDADMNNIKAFIRKKRPHVIALTTESRDAQFIKEDLEFAIEELENDGEIPRRIAVEFVDNELAKVFQNSKRAVQEFKDYPSLLRQAISLARRLQDPLIEFCQAWNPEEEILCLSYHPLQDQVAKEELLSALQVEFINRINEVGVDINRCLDHPHMTPQLQFVCGLGPRKAAQLLKILRQHDNLLETRSQLITVCQMGNKVFFNCSGFLKIECGKIKDKANSYIEMLDGTRIHPEAYEWARKMAIDALEYDENEAAPSSAVEEIFDSPDKLKDLDLDAFAQELGRQGFGNRSITLYDIRAELNHPYKDLREPYRPLRKEEIFNLLTKETPNTFNLGKLVMARVVGIARRRPHGEAMDESNPPSRNDQTGMWQCPYCRRADFTELSQVWTHFDQKQCPGEPIGVRVRLENGIMGFIKTKFLSDKIVEDPETRVQVGMPLYARVLRVDIDRFTAELSCRSSDLLDMEQQFRPPKDPNYDFAAEEEDRREEDLSKQSQQKQTYVKRVIVHPLFQNVSYKDAEKQLSGMDVGEVIIRPSSKGSDHLTVTWKVADGIYQHIDVREEGKKNAFSLGSSLWINSEEFEDLDEIVARHVQPMASFARDLLTYKYYYESQRGDKSIINQYITAEKQKNQSRIPYTVSVTKEYPGKFLLSYLPRNQVRHEYVTLTPDGYRYRSQMFSSVNALIKWFKDHFRDPIPGQTPVHGTPMVTEGGGGFSSRTPGGMTPGSNFGGHTPSGPRNWAGQPPQQQPSQRQTPFQPGTPFQAYAAAPPPQGNMLPPQGGTTPHHYAQLQQHQPLQQQQPIQPPPMQQQIQPPPMQQPPPRFPMGIAPTPGQLPPGISFNTGMPQAGQWPNIIEQQMRQTFQGMMQPPHEQQHMRDMQQPPEYSRPQSRSNKGGDLWAQSARHWGARTPGQNTPGQGSRTPRY